MALAIGLVGDAEQLLERLGVRDLLEQLHPLVVLDALHLHLVDGLAAGAVPLRVDDGPRVVERCLNDRDHVERVRRILAVEQLECGHGERRQRLVEGEVGLQVDGQPERTPVGVRRVDLLDDAAGEQGVDDRVDLGEQAVLRLLGLVALAQQPLSDARASPGREMTSSTIAWLTRMRETSCSGVPVESL